MRGAFDDYRELNQPVPGRDTELTLSATMLLMIFFALVLLCGLCFGLGYATGHRGVTDASIIAPSASAESAVASSVSQTKPDADGQANAATSQPDATADDGSSSSAGATDAMPQSPAVAAVGVPSGASPQVKPALGAGVNPIQAAQPSPSPVGPALPGAGTFPGALMVQIAAISEQVDADVLVGALRRRGYAVVERREPIDGLIHVRVGPFKTRDEADGWRQKLLNDGYNAIVQP
jgi:DedD protein